MDSGYYILNENKEVVPVMDIGEWGMFFRNTDRIVAKTRIVDCEVSTVFLGIFGNLFETMVFGGKEDRSIQRRYVTYQEALEGHKDICWEVIDLFDI